MVFCPDCVEIWMLQETKLEPYQLLNFESVNDFGPSRVRALPLAAGINVGGHYFRYYSTFVEVKSVAEFFWRQTDTTRYRSS